MPDNGDLQQQAMWAALDLTALADSTQNTVTATGERLTELRHTYAEQAVAINNNPDWTRQAKDARIGELRNTYSERAQSEIGPLLTKIDIDIGTLMARCVPPASVGDPVVAELRAQEIRASVRALDALQLRIVLLEHAGRGDAAFVDAVADSPVRTLADAATLTDARDTLRATRFPQITAQLLATIRARDTLALALRDFQRSLGGSPDSIMQAAMGKAV